METQANQIMAFILNNVGQHPQDIVALTAKKFDVTRTTVYRHLNKLLKQKKIIKSGTTRDVIYFLTSGFDRARRYPITPQLDEFNILQKDFQPAIDKLPENVASICEYGFTEIVNNAIDHSKGKNIMITTTYAKGLFTIIVEDNGIGVFRNIYDYFKLDDMRESILQLNKGKMTTNPADHTGEGIFFNSRAFDTFEIIANNLHYIRDNHEQDWAVHTKDQKTTGSKVIMSIRETSQTSLIEVFNQHQERESSTFDRTDITVELSRIGHEKLISRSQAKRITRDLEKFNRVTLDFKGVKFLGQGFVDEVFRVFQNKHPHISIDYINAKDDILFMIKRGLGTTNRDRK